MTAQKATGPRPSRRKPLDFEKDILPFTDSLYSTAYRLVMNHQDAEDLVQETCMKAFKYYDKFEPGTNLRAWLFKILKNTFINIYRKKKATPQQVDFSGIEESFETLISENIQDKADPESQFFAGLIDENVEAAMNSLPEEYHIVVVLADIEGKSYKEIADKLRIPLGTVMSRLYRGRKMLEKVLLDYGTRHGYLRHGPPAKIRKKELLRNT
jgi:RNA polymerase sigma-70 factor (ECF subfamily)